MPVLLHLPGELPAKDKSGLTDGWFNSQRAAFPGIDIREMERQFVTHIADSGTEPVNYVGKTASLFLPGGLRPGS